MTGGGLSVSQVYDEVNARGYGSGYQGPLARAEDRFVDGRIRRAVSQLHGASGRDPRVLDVGSGTGEFLRIHCPPPSCYTALDVSPRMVREARHRFPQYAARFRCADFLRYRPMVRPHLIVALWGPFNYAGFTESLRWASDTLAEGGRLCAVVYSGAHHYTDRSLYPPSVAQHLQVPLVSRGCAERALAEHFPRARRSVAPFSSARIARTPDAGYWRWSLDRMRLTVDRARSSRYLWLDVQSR